jgi:hypothetical protein
VAAFSTAADRAPTPDGPAEADGAAEAVLSAVEARAAGAAAPRAADAASAVPASKPHTRILSRPLVPMPFLM